MFTIDASDDEEDLNYSELEAENGFKDDEDGHNRSMITRASTSESNKNNNNSHTRKKIKEEKRNVFEILSLCKEA